MRLCYLISWTIGLTTFRTQIRIRSDYVLFKSLRQTVC